MQQSLIIGLAASKTISCGVCPDCALNASHGAPKRCDTPAQCPRGSDDLHYWHAHKPRGWTGWLARLSRSSIVDFEISGEQYRSCIVCCAEEAHHKATGCSVPHLRPCSSSKRHYTDSMVVVRDLVAPHRCGIRSVRLVNTIHDHRDLPGAPCYPVGSQLDGTAGVVSLRSHGSGSGIKEKRRSWR